MDYCVKALMLQSSLIQVRLVKEVVSRGRFRPRFGRGRVPVGVTLTPDYVLKGHISRRLAHAKNYLEDRNSSSVYFAVFMEHLGFNSPGGSGFNVMELCWDARPASTATSPAASQCTPSVTALSFDEELWYPGTACSSASSIRRGCRRSMRIRGNTMRSEAATGVGLYGSAVAIVLRNCRLSR
ncbi:hypothetical protein DPSP01_011762 [Paraphaeosphaeria sporulosa]